MVWTMRSVQMKLPSESWSTPDFARSFDAFSVSALSLACPFAIVRTPFAPPRRRRAKVA
jgi:hypothetical protein